MTTTTQGFGLALALALGMTGCVEQASTPNPDGPLRITEHTDDALVGSFDAGDMSVQFSARMPSDYIGVVNVTVHGKTATLRVDAYNGDIVFDGQSAELAPDEVGALQSFSQAIDAYLGGPVEDTAVMHESTLEAAAAYLAVAPANTPLDRVEKQVLGLSRAGSFSTGNDGKKCIDKGDTRNAKYDGDDGYISEPWVVGANGGQQWNGDYSCMGRCGVGCGSYDWTQDCLEHDACSRHYYSTDGIGDHNCGDEYKNAADDYASFWKRCRG